MYQLLTHHVALNYPNKQATPSKNFCTLVSLNKNGEFLDTNLADIKKN